MEIRSSLYQAGDNCIYQQQLLFKIYSDYLIYAKTISLEIFGG